MAAYCAPREYKTAETHPQSTQNSNLEFQRDSFKMKLLPLFFAGIAFAQTTAPADSGLDARGRKNKNKNKNNNKKNTTTTTTEAPTTTTTDAPTTTTTTTSTTTTTRVANHLTSTTSPRYHLAIFGGPMRTTSPHLKNIEVVSKQPHLTSKKSRLFQNNLTSPRKNRGCFETTSPHLKKIEVIFKQPHLTSEKSRWF
jgi:hypothetical protein